MLILFTSQKSSPSLKLSLSTGYSQLKRGRQAVRYKLPYQYHT
ncbi:unnamed protein product [Linum tenue]|uniref:Uncharacterized protein n=1 Tax=Linum tenue TaxID=586396 RepID=A0AAV0H8Z6_9ROSI|nr:unnamed protein product [Linum tenue]